MNDDVVRGKGLVALCLCVVLGLGAALGIEALFVQTWDPLSLLSPSDRTWGDPMLFLRWSWVACQEVESSAYFGANLRASCSALLAFAGLIGLSAGLGDLICRRFRLKELTGLERFVLSVGFGLIVVALAMIILGVLQLWHAWVVRSVLLASAAAVVWLQRDRILALVRRPSEARAERRRRAGRIDPRPWLERGIFSLCAVAVVWLMFLGLVPQSFYDSLVYHLGVPNQWMQNHGIGFLPGHFFSNFPMSHGVVAATLLYIGPDVTVGLVQPFYLALSLVALHCARKRVLPNSWFPAEALVLLASRPLIENAPRTGNDVFVMMYFSLGLLAFVRWRQTVQAHWVFVLGLLLGAALSAKYTVAVYIPVFAALLFGLSWRASGPKEALFDMGRLAAGGLVAPLPWLLKNLALTGNPVWPLLSSVFGTLELHESGLAAITRQSSSRVRDWGSFIDVPWVASVATQDLTHLIGPAFLMLLPLAALAIFLDRTRVRESLLYAAGGLACWIIWILTFRVGRYASPAMAVSALLYGLAIGQLLARLPRPFAYATSLATTAGLWILTSYFLTVGSLRHSAAAYHCGEVYVAERPNLAQTMFEVINRLDPDVKVILLGDNRTFGLQRPHVSTTVFDRPLLTRYLEGADNAAELYARLRADGITHVAVNLLEGARLHRNHDAFDHPPEWQQVWTTFWRAHTDLVQIFPGMVLVEITDVDTPGRRTVADPIAEVMKAVGKSPGR